METPKNIPVGVMQNIAPVEGCEWKHGVVLDEAKWVIIAPYGGVNGNSTNGNNGVACKIGFSLWKNMKGKR